MEEYGTVFGLRVLTQTRIVTCEPEHVKAILASQFETFNKGKLALSSTAIYYKTRSLSEPRILKVTFPICILSLEMGFLTLTVSLFYTASGGRV